MVSLPPNGSSEPCSIATRCSTATPSMGAVKRTGPPSIHTGRPSGSTRSPPCSSVAGTAPSATAASSTAHRSALPVASTVFAVTRWWSDSRWNWKRGPSSCGGSEATCAAPSRSTTCVVELEHHRGASHCQVAQHGGDGFGVVEVLGGDRDALEVRPRRRRGLVGTDDDVASQGRRAVRCRDGRWVRRAWSSPMVRTAAAAGLVAGLSGGDTSSPASSMAANPGNVGS